MKRCEKCILPDTYPQIQFDDDGVCNECKNYKAIEYKGEEALRKLLSDTVSHSEWDCLVPLSGGRDSTFTLHQLVKKYKKRVLVYNYDNGFVEPIARENIQQIANTLGVKVIYHSSEDDLQCKNIRWITKQNISKTPGHVQAYLCSGCRNGIWGGAYKVAEEYNIPLIVFGESSMESGGFKRHIAPHFTPNMAEKLTFMIRHPHITLKRKIVEKKLHKQFPLPSELSNVQKINLFDYEKWDEDVILTTIRQELGWKQKENQSSWRFDCQIHALVNSMVYNMLGMTEKDELYSKMIREGMMTREEALERIYRSKEDIATELMVAEKVLNRMGMTDNEKKKIIQFCKGEPKLKNDWVV
ncbi:MAG: hypothetical protein ACK5HT_02675 [Draconibacterium sp.]